MTQKRARQLTMINIDKIADLKYCRWLKVKLIDAWRESKAYYGYSQAVKDGYYQLIESNYATGYTPRDMWLTNALECRLDQIELKEKKLILGGAII